MRPGNLSLGLGEPGSWVRGNPLDPIGGTLQGGNPDLPFKTVSKNPSRQSLVREYMFAVFTGLYKKPKVE